MNELGLRKVDGHFTTSAYIAEFYGVKIEAIKTLVKRNRKLFDEFGNHVIEGDSLREVINRNPDLSRYMSTLLLISEKSVVCMAYLLSNSDVTLGVILHNSKTNKSFHNELLRLNTNQAFIKKYERELGFLIHSVFDEFYKVEDQVLCGKYLIDFVINGNIAIECDENGHSCYNQEKEHKREEYLKRSGYSILRYDTRKNNMLGFIGEISNFLCVNNLSTNSAF